MAPPSLPYEMHEKLNPCSDLLCKNATLLPVFWWKYKCQPKVTDVAQPKCPILHHLASEPHQSVDAPDNMISKRGQPRNGPTHPRGKGRKGDTHTPPKTLSPLLPFSPFCPAVIRSHLLWHPPLMPPLYTWAMSHCRSFISLQSPLIYIWQLLPSSFALTLLYIRYYFGHLI